MKFLNARLCEYFGPVSEERVDRLQAELILCIERAPTATAAQRDDAIFAAFYNFGDPPSTDTSPLPALTAELIETATRYAKSHPALTTKEIQAALFMLVGAGRQAGRGAT